ncbi:hypothetical protein Q9S36_24030 [Microbacterium sp. ARD31]|uniref:hypothetical protein n=1 Tax=Microbacterium sp. ARD31 TaxID=2962576 RepID=UPI00288283E3|nr:hypothetical protein [Microbacterium sp. ARD31]MDT0183258.1 hypothetical protein [Microbacterium sp. ARD31]
MKTVSLAAVAALAVLVLTGCASAAGEVAAPTATVTTTATVTATVTATPGPTSAPASPDDPLTALDAWLLCYGATYGEYRETSTLFPYTEGSASGNQTVTGNADGSFEVLVPFAPTSGEGYGAESICVAGGTVGEPTVELRGGRDFG